MSGSNDGEEGFVFSECVVIANRQHQINAIIRPNVFKFVEEKRYVKLHRAFSECRGLVNLLTCKLPSTMKADEANKYVSMALNEIRSIRDSTFRQLVESESVDNIKFVGCTTPRCRTLRPLAMGVAEAIDVEMPALEGVHQSCTMSVLTSTGRSNRNSPLWVELTPKVCDHLVKLILEKYETRSNGGDSAADVEGEDRDSHDDASEPDDDLEKDGGAPDAGSQPQAKKPRKISDFFKSRSSS